MHLEKVTFKHNTFPTTEVYPFNLKLLQETRDIVFSKPVTFFVGENGSGKTTVLKGICRCCGIHIWQDEERRRYQNNPYEEELHRYLDIEWADGHVPGSYYGSQIFQDFTKSLDDWAVATPGILEYFGGESLMTKSHGQSLMAYFTARYKIKGLYLLDEPEAALSPKTQLALLKLFSELTKDGNAQFIVASQSPILLAYPDALIYSFDHIPLKTIRYEDTEHFRVYHDFLANWRKYTGTL
jgi:predicted ATPase